MYEHVLEYSRNKKHQKQSLNNEHQIKTHMEPEKSTPEKRKIKYTSPQIWGGSSRAYPKIKAQWYANVMAGQPTP